MDRLIKNFRTPRRSSLCGHSFASYDVGRLTPPPPKSRVAKYPSNCQIIYRCTVSAMYKVCAMYMACKVCDTFQKELTLENFYLACLILAAPLTRPVTKSCMTPAVQQIRPATSVLSLFVPGSPTLTPQVHQLARQQRLHIPGGHLQTAGRRPVTAVCRPFTEPSRGRYGVRALPRPPHRPDGRPWLD